MRAELYETGGVGWGDDSAALWANDDAGLTVEEIGALLEDAGGIFDTFKKVVSTVTKPVAKAVSTVTKPIATVAKPFTKVAGTVAHAVEQASKPLGRMKIPGGVPLLGGMQLGHVTGIALAPAKVASGVLQGQRVDRALLGAAKNYATTVGKTMPIVTNAVPILKPFAAPLGAVGGAAEAWGEGATRAKDILSGAGQGALQGAMSMIPGLGGGSGATFGTLLNKMPTLPVGSIRNVAEQLMGNPSLRSLPVNELASALGVSPSVANEAIASVAQAAREAGELGAGALPPLRVAHPAVRQIVGTKSMYKALPKISSVARTPVQSASPVRRAKASKRAVARSPVYRALHPTVQRIVLSDAAGLDGGAQAKVMAPSGLNVRASASASSTKRGAVAYGSTVTATGASVPGAKLDATAPSEGGWTPIAQGSLSGYVLTEWLVPVAAPTTAPTTTTSAAAPAYAKVTTNDPAPAGDLIIRSAASASGAQIGAAEKNGTVQIVNWNASADYAQVRWPGGSRHPAVTGYAAKKYLVATAAPGAPSTPTAPTAPALPSVATISPEAERIARHASADLWLAEWARQYPYLSTGFGPTNFSPDWTPAAQAELARFAVWANQNGASLSTSGVLDDATYEALRKWFEASSGGPVHSLPGTPAPPVVVVPSLPSLPSLPSVPVVVPTTPAQPVPIPNISAGAGAGVQVQPAQPAKSDSGSGLLVLGGLAVAALAMSGGKK